MGGMEHGVIKVANRLDPDRFVPSICALSSQAEATRGLLAPRIGVIELHSRGEPDWRVIAKLARVFHRESIDIAHSHNWGTLFYTVMAGTLARVPIMIHGEHGNEGESVPRRRRLLQRWLAGRVTRLTTVSDDLFHELVERWRVRPERVSTIPNGVDLDTFGREYPLDVLRREFGLTTEHHVLMTIGGVRQVKDYPTLIRAFARVYRRLPTARLLIIGSTHVPGALAKLEALARDLGVHGEITFTGIRHDTPQLLALSHVYVNSSVFEGMSNTILEAMAARKPVVATSVGGNPELVRDGVTGYLVPSGDDQVLADRLERLLSDPSLSRGMGHAGQAQVERDHQLSGMVARYSDLYREMAARASFRPRLSFGVACKRVAARAIRWSGLGLVTARHRPAPLTILTYHRVLPLHEAQAYPFQGMMMSRDLFEAQMAYLSRHVAVLGLGEAVDLLRRGHLPGRAVAVTFDDGYRDNFDYAWPILKKYGIPATFFVVTDVLDQQLRLWWDEVAELIDQLSARGLHRTDSTDRLPNWAARIVSKLRPELPSGQVTSELVTRMNDISLTERRGIMGTLYDLVRPGAREGAHRMLTWDQILELEDSGMGIGSHTSTHAFFDELDEEAIEYEISGSVARLTSRLKQPIRFFSYPRGRVVGHSRRWLEKVGVEAAVTTSPGLNQPGSDLYQLKRIDAGYCSPKEGFDRAIFEAEIQGWFAAVRSGMIE
jgi:glycosyltransferase involved in cell wall biosynthesis/peptidoglycan/xylan/chitin deacetylase (PgdA/CDA1 family)